IPRIAYKVKDPETFSGELQKFRNFTSQLDLVFVSDPAGFSEDQRKIVYAASYLRGSAYSWFEGQGLAAFPSYNTFLEKLRSAFSDPNPENTAQQKLRKLKQGDRPCSVYNAEFLSIMAYLGYNEQAKWFHYRDGLREELKDLLVGRAQDITSLEEFMRLCIVLDNDCRRRREESKSVSSAPAMQGDKKKSSTTAVNYSPAPEKASSTNLLPGPMELGSTKRGPLTDAEKKFRRDNNLCSYCGQGGHYASSCPNKGKKKGSKVAAATITESDSPTSASPAPQPNASVAAMYTVQPAKK